MLTVEDLKTYVENNPKLVTVKVQDKYPNLNIIKYRRNVFYDNSWTPELELCRGLVVDNDWNIVVRPFTKIYNYMERGTKIHPEEYVTSVRKVNGFMAAVTYHPDYGCIVSTTGSLDSDFVELAKKYVSKFFDYIEHVSIRGGFNHTWLFEICSPEDPHIIDEVEGAYLIGCQLPWISDMYLPQGVLDTHADLMGAMRPKWQICMFGELLKEVQTVKHEGFVVYGKTTNLKIKSPYYLTTKFLARIKGETLSKMLKTGQWQSIDEEFYPLMEHLQTVHGFCDVTEQDRISIIRDWFYKRS